MGFSLLCSCVSCVVLLFAFSSLLLLLLFARRQCDEIWCCVPLPLRRFMVSCGRLSIRPPLLCLPLRLFFSFSWFFSSHFWHCFFFCLTVCLSVCHDSSISRSLCFTISGGRSSQLEQEEEERPGGGGGVAAAVAAVK